MRHILAWTGLWVALLTSFACGSPAGPAPPESSAPPEAPVPSLLLVTIDTWRWDYIGASGAGKVETPNLDRLAREGVYEREAVTPCPLTTPAHASIMTGLEPLHHGVWDCTLYPLREGVPTLAEAFLAAGFTTAAFVASETLNRRYGLGRGFDRYDDVPLRQGKSEEWWAASRNGAEVTDAFLSFLRSRQAGEKIFAWVHYYDAHLPYRLRPKYDGRYPRDPYAAQVAFVDGEAGRLLAALGEDGRSWRVVVAGDHGEGLGDRGEATHGMGLYRSTLHVPLILHPPPERALRHPKPWGLVDLEPTLLDWYGLPPQTAKDGESLLSEGIPGRALYSASLLPALFFGVTPSTGVRQGSRFYLRCSAEELYDTAGDPGQTRDMARAPEARAEMKALRALADRRWPEGWFTRVLPAVPSLAAGGLDDLRSLGYISGGPPAAAKVQRGPIGQVLKDHSTWELARAEAQATGRINRLLTVYPPLLARYPNSFALLKDYGACLAKAGRAREAIAPFEKAARLYPGDSVVMGNLGALYLSQGNAEAARIALERSVAIDPDRAGTQKNLGILYLDNFKQPDRAIPHFKKYLEAGGDAEADRIRAFIAERERAGPPGPR